MIRIESIIAGFQSYTKHQIDCSPLQKAWILAVRHLSEVKLVGPSRLDLAMERAQILVDLHADLPSLIAGLLLDLPLVALESQMGGETARIAAQANQLRPQPGKVVESEDLARSMKEVIATALADLRSLVVTLAARQVQLTQPSGSKQWRRELAKETLEIYAPIAERLGLNHVKLELENHAFRILHPLDAKEIQTFLQKNEKRFLSLMSRFQERAEQLLAKAGLEVQVKGRVKHAYSLWRKAHLLKIGFEHVHDLLGIRVIVNNVDDAYKALGVFNNFFHPVHDRYKNYISFPKPNGYQSLHAFVFDDLGQGFDVQIRTHEMNRIAEYGVASHWAYKAGEQPHLAADDQDWLKDLSERLQVASDPQEALDIFTRELYSDQIYVFTPKGKIIKLPLGATVLDFAYSIHSEIGHRCTGALINGAHKSLSHEIHQGDKVEILTDEHQEPKPEWLKIAKSAKSLAHIRSLLKKKEIKEAQRLGQEIFFDLLTSLGRNKNQFLESQELKEFLSKSHQKSLEDYWTKLGFGQITLKGLQQHLYSGSLAQRRRLGLHYFKRPTGVRIAGLDNEMIRFANCCNPVKGDPIVGILIQGKGVSIHLADCGNLHAPGVDPGRLVEVEWVKSSEETLPVWLQLKHPESLKLHQEVLKAVARHKALLVEAHFRVTRGQAEMEMLIKVSNLDQLSKLLKRLNSIPDLEAERRQAKTGEAIEP